MKKKSFQELAWRKAGTDGMMAHFLFEEVFYSHVIGHDAAHRLDEVEVPKLQLSLPEAVEKPVEVPVGTVCVMATPWVHQEVEKPVEVPLGATGCCHMEVPHLLDRHQSDVLKESSNRTCQWRFPL